MKGREVLTLVLLVGLGSLQMIGDVAGAPRLKAVAAALQVSPAMKVFTAQQGYETHAARFRLHWRDANGQAQALQLGPGPETAIAGPYNRRNVYGAALAYGPLLRGDPRTRAMQESVMHHAFCHPGRLRAELGIPQRATDLWVEIAPLRADARRDLDYTWRVNCHG
jgi:hypothetical protein